MNLNQLRAFREVMRTGSVSDAARNLRRTQPAVSAQIAALESDLDCKLFLRGGGRLKPVPEARYLLEEAEEVLDRLTSTARILRNVRDLEHGALQIASMPGPSTVLLPDIIGRFVKNRNSVKVSLVSQPSSEVLQLVSSQQFDVGLVDLNAGGIKTTTLVDSHALKVPCFCAVTADDPLARKEVVTASDLDGYPLATLYQDHITSQRTRAAFETAGAAYTVRFEAQFFMPLLSYVEKGLSAAVVSALCAESYRMERRDHGNVVFRPFEPSVYLEFAVVTPAHRPQSALAAAFRDMLMQEFARIGAEPLLPDPSPSRRRYTGTKHPQLT